MRSHPPCRFPVKRIVDLAFRRGYAFISHMKNNAINQLAKTAGLASGAEAVYLFGSQARGQGGADSDYDLALLLPNGSDPWQATRAAQRSLWPRTVPVDLVPITRRSWDREENAFIREIRGHSELLYSKDG